MVCSSMVRARPSQALHWKDWVLLQSEKAIDAEFNKQLVDLEEVGRLLLAGTFTTPADVFERWSVSENSAAAR
jgi:hypothetical protein